MINHIMVYKYRYNLALLLLGLIFHTACSASQTPTTQEEIEMSLQIASPAFQQGETIPQKYTCDAENISPPLTWSGIPENTQSLALIVDDPDAPAGTWVHWVLFNIPPTRSNLPEKANREITSQGLGMQGINDFQHIDYGGPCPPPGKSHRYFFHFYALDTQLQLEPGATRQEVDAAMERHILAKGELMGTFER